MVRKTVIICLMTKAATNKQFYDFWILCQPISSAQTANQPTIDWTQAIPIGKISEKTDCYCFAWACITSQAIRLKKKF